MSINLDFGWFGYMSRKNCKNIQIFNIQYFAAFYRQLTIVPFEKTDIYLLVLDSEDCARKQIIDRIQTPRDNVFLPQKQRKEQKGIWRFSNFTSYKVPYCNLTTDYINMHRRRTDLDYTVIHENASFNIT